MIIELGNFTAKGDPIDDRPKVTSIHIPEADADGLGGYTHKIGALDHNDLKDHFAESMMRDEDTRGITQQPDHEIAISVLHPGEGTWVRHGKDKPRWVNCIPHELTPPGVAEDLQQFLSNYWEIPGAPDFFRDDDPEGVLVKKELSHWTNTPPGVLPGPTQLPDISATYTNNGRVISNLNDGGGQVGAIGVGSASTGTSLTVSGTPGWASNQYAGYRIVVYSTTSNNMVWGNITANGTGTNPSITVDRWYVASNPGGSAGTTPTTPWAFMILDGGFTSTWFVALATGAFTPAASDTTLATSGNVEIVTAGGGLIRKIAPYAQTSGIATRAITLTPVYTVNGSDSIPATVTTIGVFCSMVVGTVGTMKFATPITSAVMGAVSDQLTLTETVNGS